MDNKVFKQILKKGEIKTITDQGNGLNDLTPEQLEEFNEYIKNPPKKRINKQSSEILIASGKISEILDYYDGDISQLSPDELKALKEQSKRDSEAALEAKAMQIASSPGYQDFMTLPLMSKMFKTNPKRNTEPTTGYQYNMGANGKVGGVKEAEDNRPAENVAYEKSQEDKKEPLVEKSNPNTSQDLRVNDSESDILTKMFNFMKRDYEFRSNMEKDKEKYRKEVAERKNAYTDQLIEALTGKKPSKTKKFGTLTKKSGLFKYAAFAGAGVGAFMLSKSSLANIDWKAMLPSFESPKDPGVTKEAPLIMEQSEDMDAARKAAESYLGKKISDKEWDVLLRTTAAESANDTTSQAMVMASILNRARTRFPGEENSIIKTVEQKNQFQAVTGTSFNNNQPSEKYKTGPSKSETKSIIAGAINILPKVNREQTDFTATDPKAYGPGTNIENLYRMRREGGYERAGSIFNKPAPLSTDNNQTPNVSEKVSQSDKDTTIPQKIKVTPKKPTQVSIIGNNTNIVNGATNYNVAGTTNDNSSLVDKQYFTYG
jgi:hypothetical protein